MSDMKLPLKLFPADAPRLGAPESEQKIWTRLRDGGLPEGWHAWHSLAFGEPGQRVHEIDFVLAAPETSVVLLLEVKGGQLSQRNGHWYRYDTRIASPAAQMHAARSAFVQRLRSLCGEQAPWVESLLLLPDTYSDRGPAQDDLRGRTLGAAEIRHLARHLRDIVAGMRHPRRVEDWIPKIHALWGERWQTRVVLPGEAALERDQERMVRLSDEQAWVMDALDENPRLLVRGGAGTGKSVLVGAAARQEAAAGRRVRIVTWTRALARGLADRLGEHARVSTIDEWCADVLGMDPAELDAEHSGSWWDDLPLRAAGRLERDNPPRDCDTLIVDEAQDLTTNHALFLDVASRGEGQAPLRLRVFGDDHGQRYWRERISLDDWPDEAARLRLRRPLRCAPAIQHLAQAWAGFEEADPAQIAAGIADESLLLWTASPDRRLHQLRKLLRRLQQAGYGPADIAILSLLGQAHPEGLIRNHPDDLEGVAADHPEAGRRLVLDTFLRFKGLERPAVILTDIAPAGGQANYGTRMHIAASRATTTLRILTTEPAVAADRVLQQMVPGF